MRRLTAQQVAAHLQDAEPYLLDVREPWEFDICSINGSVNIPMSQIMSRMEEILENDEIVVICHHGIRSMQVAGFLETRGEANLINLEGGVEAWAREIDPEMAVY